MYGNIDMERTAILLKELFDGSGYTVKDIQKILHDLLHQLILAETVNEIEQRLPATDLNLPVEDIIVGTNL